MSKKDTGAKKPEVDQHGLVVHKYTAQVLVIVPPKDYAETTLRYARSALFNVHVGTFVVSTDDQSFLRGELQDEFQVDGLLSGISLEPHAGLILCGGPGALMLADDPDAVRLTREASQQDKLIGAWGHSVAVLARAGIVRKKRVTGDRSLQKMLEEGGARYTGAQVERDGKIVTALDDAAGFRFGKALVQIVKI